jgi:hypothetical protein
MSQLEKAGIALLGILVALMLLCLIGAVIVEMVQHGRYNQPCQQACQDKGYEEGKSRAWGVVAFLQGVPLFKGGGPANTASLSPKTSMTDAARTGS